MIKPSFFVIALLLALPVHAQSYATGIERSLPIVMSPQYPSPGERVKLSIEGYAVDIDSSIVVWYVDNEEVSRGPGLRDVEITTGAIGSAQKIRVFAEEPSGIIAIGEATVRPTELTLLWESESYTPPFYRGRALPGSGSVIRAHALTNFRIGRDLLRDEDLVFSWYRDGMRLASGRGRSSISFTGPYVFETDRISVVAESLDGVLAGEAEITLRGRDPELELYEHHPLFGTLYHRAFVGTVLTGEDEQTVAVVPFFASTDPRDKSLTYGWTFAGREAPPSLESPDILNLYRGPGFSGVAELTLSLSSTADIFLAAEGAWSILFGDATTFENPFIAP